MAPFKILDGAMGSELIRRGLTLPKHTWSADANITNPEVVQKIHREYVDAGANYITSNTFRTTPRAYEKAGGVKNQGNKKRMTDAFAKNALYKGVELAKNAAKNAMGVVGSIAPLEDCYAPDLFPGTDTAIMEFSQLGKWLKGAGVDILLLETMNSMVEAEAALVGTQNLGLPIWISFVLQDDRHLLSGDGLFDTLNLMKSYSVDTVLLNCNPLDRTLMAAENLVDRWSGKWGVYPNLGVGEPSPDGHIFQHEKMSHFRSTMEKIIGLCPFIIGTCCGSSPKHIQCLNNLQYEFSK